MSIENKKPDRHESVVVHCQVINFGELEAKISELLYELEDAENKFGWLMIRDKIMKFTKQQILENRLKELQQCQDNLQHFWYKDFPLEHLSQEFIERLNKLKYASQNL